MQYMYTIVEIDRWMDVDVWFNNEFCYRSGSNRAVSNYQLLLNAVTNQMKRKQGV